MLTRLAGRSPLYEPLVKRNRGAGSLAGGGARHVGTCGQPSARRPRHAVVNATIASVNLRMDDTPPFARAHKLFATMVENVFDTARVQQIDATHLSISVNNKRAIVTFTVSELEDIEAALALPNSVGQHAQQRSYVKGIRSAARFKIFLALAGKGMLPDTDVSKLMMDDERDWHKAGLTCPTRFDETTAKGVYDGLCTLRASLHRTLSANKLEVPGVSNELDQVNSLIDHFDEHRNLNIASASVSVLSMLKGAAVCWIIDLETSKAAEPSLRAKDTYDELIWDVVHRFHMTDPFNRIQLPPALYDFAAQPKNENTTESSGLVDIDDLLTKVNPRLIQRRAGAWHALRSKKPDHVSQAANSMVEILRTVVNHVCDGRKFEDVLRDRFPQQERLNKAIREWVAATKTGLEDMKHGSSERSAFVAEDLMNAAELMIRSLLR